MTYCERGKERTKSRGRYPISAGRQESRSPWCQIPGEGYVGMGSRVAARPQGLPRRVQQILTWRAGAKDPVAGVREGDAEAESYRAMTEIRKALRPFPEAREAVRLRLGTLFDTLGPGEYQQPDAADPNVRKRG